MGEMRDPKNIFSHLDPDWINRIFQVSHSCERASADHNNRQRNLEKYCQRQQEGKELFTGEDLDGIDLADNFGAVKSSYDPFTPPIVHRFWLVPEKFRDRIKDYSLFADGVGGSNLRFLKGEQWNDPSYSTPPEQSQFANAS